MASETNTGLQHVLLAGKSLQLALPDSRAVQDAYAQAQEESEPWLFHHVVRSWLYGSLFAKRSRAALDMEVFSIAVLLHDLGLAQGGSPDRRFEVFGADQGRSFALSRGLTVEQAETVWDSIALHTTGSVAVHKKANVAHCHTGIACDFGALGLDRLSQREQQIVLEAFPRLQMKHSMTACLSRLVSTHPATVRDNFVAEFGERYVPGYQRFSTVDLLNKSPFAE